MLLMGVLRAGSGSFWLYTKLSISVLLHNPDLRDQWQFLRGNVKHSNFLSTVASSPFFCLSAISNGLHQQISCLLQQVSPKSTGRVEPMLPTLRTAVLSVPLPFSFPRRGVASYLLSHTLQTAYSSSSAGGPCSIASVPLNPHSKQQGWLQVFTPFTAGVAAHWKMDAHSSKCRRRKKKGQNEWTCRWDDLFDHHTRPTE